MHQQQPALKTLWEKKNLTLWFIDIHFPNQTLVFTCLSYKTFENTVGKGEMARNEQFLLFPKCFLPIWRALCHFYQIQNCRLQTLSVWKSLKFAVWERVNTLTTDSFWKHCWKRRIAPNEQFLLFARCFLLNQKIAFSVVDKFWHHIFIGCWIWKSPQLACQIKG